MVEGAVDGALFQSDTCPVAVERCSVVGCERDRAARCSLSIDGPIDDQLACGVEQDGGTWVDGQGVA